MSYYSLPLTATDDSDPEHLHTPVDTPYYYPPPEPDHACTWQSSGVMPYGATPKIVTGSGSYISDLPYNGHHLAAAAIPSDDQLNSYAGTGVRRSGFDDSMRSNMQQGLGHHRGYPYKLNPEAAQGYSHDDYYADSGYGDSRSEDLLAHDTAARLEGNSHLISSRHGLTQASPASDYGHGHGTRHPGFALTSANFEAHAAVPGPAYVGAHAQYETASHHYNEELQYPNIDPHATSLVSSRTPYALDDPHTPDLVLEEPGHSFEVTQQPHSLSTLPQGHGYHPALARLLRVCGTTLIGS
ncbi:hypothetical protein OBBRIDRAFT_71134 [Obba rivulosa]|uniref:Uncharacterized protein n=1 Tax=Obba rivulosa TaxID=1052685 RepID=A0A8E2AV51_9APHY|nr:hypothetical protein OBBRIDRAFT_71134 [Obba rivulosa]